MHPSTPEPPSHLPPSACAAPRYSGRIAQLHTWSGQRPWLGGLLTVLSGLTILLLPPGGVAVVVLPGVAGISALLLGGLLIAGGLSLLSAPHRHGVLGIATVLLALASFASTNLGGFVIGMLLGIVGGALGFAWNPPDPRPATNQ